MPYPLQELHLQKMWKWLTGQATSPYDFTTTGDIGAKDGVFTGNLSAVDGTFTGDISAVGGTFTGNISAVDGTLTGNLNVTGYAYINPLGTVYSKIGPDPLGVTLSNAQTALFVTKQQPAGASTSIKRAIIAVGDFAGTANSAFSVMGLNAFAESHSTSSLTAPTAGSAGQGGLCSGRYQTANRSTGIVRFATGLSARCRERGGGTIYVGAAFNAENGTKSGTFQTQIAYRIQAQTTGTNNVGIFLHGASTGTVAGGIILGGDGKGAGIGFGAAASLVMSTGVLSPPDAWMYWNGANMLMDFNTTGGLVLDTDTASALTIGNGATGVDYALTFDGETNDGVITWMEDEDYFKVGDDVVFDGDAGLCYAEIYAEDAALEHTIAGSGEANKVQVTAFNTNGASNNTTPDHTNDHITVDIAGHYFCAVSLTVNSLAGSSAQFGFAVFKNNGATKFSNLHAHRDLPAGAGGNSGSITLSGIIDLSVNDTIEFWVWNETNTQNIEIDDVTLSLLQIGGT